MNFLMQLPKDKLGHTLAGLVMFNFALLFLNVVTSLILVVIVAMGKEIYDYFHRDKHTPDFLDFIATISVPVVLTILIYLKGGIYA